jgi:hypothetical protein
LTDIVEPEEIATMAATKAGHSKTAETLTEEELNDTVSHSKSMTDHTLTYRQDKIPT